MRPAERRRHRVFKTRHTEYHLRHDECVGVRDRQSGLWLIDHAALRLRAIRAPAAKDSAQWIGRRLCFWGDRSDVLTSPVIDVDRPAAHDLVGYVSHARTGTIELMS